MSWHVNIKATYSVTDAQNTGIAILRLFLSHSANWLLVSGRRLPCCVVSKIQLHTRRSDRSNLMSGHANDAIVDSLSSLETVFLFCFLIDRQIVFTHDWSGAQSSFSCRQFWGFTQRQLNESMIKLSLSSFPDALLTENDYNVFWWVGWPSPTSSRYSDILKIFGILFKEYIFEMPPRRHQSREKPS